MYGGGGGGGGSVFCGSTCVNNNHKNLECLTFQESCKCLHNHGSQCNKAFIPLHSKHKQKHNIARVNWPALPSTVNHCKEKCVWGQKTGLCCQCFLSSLIVHFAAFPPVTFQFRCFGD